MKKHLSLFLFIYLLTSTLPIYGQKEIQINDVEILNLGDGRLFAHQQFRKDSVINGKVRLITGYTTEYIDAEFKDGFAIGKWEYYKQNKLVEVINHVDGYQNGEKASYYPDGTPKSKTNLVKGVVDGKALIYHPNGNVQIEKNWKMGIDDGVERNYNENGKLWMEANFKNGKAEGKSMMIVTSDGGDYTQTTFYKNGLPEGEYSRIFENGVVKEKGNYIAGKKDGIWQYNKADGTKKLTEGYKNGELTKKITYYANGNIDAERNYKNDKEDGAIKKYALDGTLKSEQNYVNGKQVGKQIMCFVSNNGNYTETSNYNDKGQKEGEYSEIYTENNSVKSKGKYINGQKEGVWIYGYKHGIIYKEETYKDGTLVDTKKP